MYGVPKDLDISRFNGALLTAICIGEFQVQFHFQQTAANLHQSASISVEGKWELRDSSGVVVDEMQIRNEPISKRKNFHAHCLLGSTVVGFRIQSPEFITLQFSSGHVLTVFDDSCQYESFSIQPGNIYI